MAKGFTLVELAIVLVIIGLLIGGVLSGQELIKQSKIRSISARISSYKLSIATFQSKYNALPGDFARGAQFFPNCVVITGSSACSGNGDGIMQTNSDNPEFIYFWRHLSMAGLLPADYNKNAIAVVDEDYPSIQVLNSDLYNIAPSYSYDPTVANDMSGNIFAFTYNDSNNEVSNCGDIGQFDTKFDDGKYNTGLMRIYSEEGDDCSDTGGGVGAYKDESASGIAQFYIKL